MSEDAKKIHEKPTIELKDSGIAPDIFSDASAGLLIANGVMRITFEAIRANHMQTPAGLERLVVSRVIMPIEKAAALAKDILNILEKHRTGQYAMSTGTQMIQ